jgi:hypothetical protein
MMPLAHIGIPMLPFLFRDDPGWDIRLLVLGGLLPDLIDKPLGHLIMPENNGRIFAHSLIFALSLLLIALAYRPLMPLSLGVSMHQLLDGTFLDPGGAAWPFLGPFESTDYQLIEWIHALTDPYTITEEMIGLSIIILIVYRFDLLKWRRLLTAARTGRLGRKRTQ